MRLLVITHTFPPSVISNAKRPFYVVHDLLQRGWEVDVFTSHCGLQPGEGETVSHPNLRIIRPTDVFTGLRQIDYKHRWARWITLAVNAFIWPDNLVFWARKAVSYALSNRGKYDRVLGYVVPPSVLLAGRAPDLVDQTWTFDFQEPISPQDQHHPRRSPIQRAFFQRTYNLERHTLSKVGRAIFTSESNRQAYIQMKLIRPDKAVHIPFFYDSAAFLNLPKVCCERFEIAYFGSFDWRGDRSPETFLRAFAGFLAAHPEARPRARFAFYGPWLQEHTPLVEELRLQDTVSINPYIPYSDYLERLKASPVLLLVVSASHNLFMPSKIVDYLGARRPILAFVNRHSEMRQVLEVAGMADYACDEFDAEAGALSIAKLWERFKAGQLTASSDTADRWSSDRNLPLFRAILDHP